MHARNKGVLIGMSGFVSGGLAYSVAELPTWPKAGLVCAVSLAFSMIVGVIVGRARSA